MIGPIKVEPVVNRTKVLDLLALQAEYATLDFKVSCDLRKECPDRKRNQVELAKDIGAMSVHGGYLVLGVDGQGRPTGELTSAQAKFLDEARLRPMLLTWLPDTLEMCSQEHQVDSCTVVLVYVAPNPAGCAVFRADGQHPDGKSTKTIFRQGDVFFRDGTESRRMSQQGLEQVIARRMTPVNHTLFETSYRKSMIDLLSDVRLHGLELPPHEQTYKLTTAYVNLSVRTAIGQEYGEGAGTRFEDLLSAHQLLFLEGPAGAGKTTLLQQLSLHIYKGDLPAELREWQEAGIDPFLLRLRRYVDSEGLHLPTPEEFVEQDIAAGKPETWVTERLHSGKAIVMVDGIDEIPQQYRPELMSWLDRLIRLYKAARFVLTARPDALHPAQIEQLEFWGFTVAHIEPMTAGQVNEFIARWHATNIEVKAGFDSPEEQARKLIEALATRRDLARLASNPLLCAMLCALNRTSNSELPQGRNALYNAALTMLLEARDRERRIPHGALNLSRAQAEPLLSRMAMWMTLNGRRTIDRDVALEKIDDVLPRLRQVQTDSTKVLDFLRERSGLLQEPTSDLLEFRHPSFQDYLAAADIFKERNLKHLILRAEDPLYHDVIIMAIGLSQQDPARQEQLLNGLLERARKADEHAQTLWLLAAACIADVELIAPRYVETISLRTQELLPPKSSEEAERLAKAGPFVFDLVADIALTRVMTEREAAATIHLALQTGGDDAILLISRLSARGGKKVHDAVVAGWLRSRAPERYMDEILRQRPMLNISLSEFDLDRLPFLHRLTNLHSLRMSNIRKLQDRDLASLRELTSLQVIDLSKTNIENLESLADLTELEELTLDDTGVTDIAPLAGNTHLHALHLNRTKLHSLQPLAFHSGLRALYLDRTSVSDLSPLANHSDLTDLRLAETQVSDISSLAELTGMESLNIDGTRVSDLNPLARMSELTTLTLNRTEVSELAPIARCMNLCILQFNNTNVGDLTPIASLVRLHTLFAVSTRIRDLRPLAALTSLRNLYLSAQALTDPGPLKAITGLRELNIGGRPNNMQAIQRALPNVRILTGR